jgi:hypothetical protein
LPQSQIADQVAEIACAFATLWQSLGLERGHASDDIGAFLAELAQAGKSPYKPRRWAAARA